MMRRSNIFSGFVCTILFIYLFMHESDPYFAYDNVVVNISGFSQLTGSMANGMKWLFKSSESIRNWIVDVLDLIFQYSIPEMFEKLTYGPLLRIVEMFERLYDKLGWFE